MKFENIQIGMFVSVTDEYRAKIPAAITWGKGQGKVIGFEKTAGSWLGGSDINVCSIKWADRLESTMHPVHLQPSTKKKYFVASLG